MKKKNIDKKVVFSIGGLCTLCLVLLAGTWYLNYEPTEEFTPATQEVETLADTWDDKLESDVPEASVKEEPLYDSNGGCPLQQVIRRCIKKGASLPDAPEPATRVVFRKI